MSASAPSSASSVLTPKSSPSPSSSGATSSSIFGSVLPPTTPGTNLTLDEVGACNRAAQFDGTLYGTAAGSLGGLFSFRFLKQNKNVSLFSGILTGVIAGYVVSRQALTTRIARAEADKLKLEQEKLASTLKDDKEVQWDMNRKEGGVGGLERFEDKYATTRGDH